MLNMAKHVERNRVLDTVAQRTREVMSAITVMMPPSKQRRNAVNSAPPPSPSRDIEELRSLKSEDEPNPNRIHHQLTGYHRLELFRPAAERRHMQKRGENADRTKERATKTISALRPSTSSSPSISL